MAKAPKAPAAPAAPKAPTPANPAGLPANPVPSEATQVASPQAPTEAGSVYQIEVGGPPPERTRAFGGGDRAPSPYAKLFADMPLPEGDSYAQVFIPIADDAVPAGITDGEEREKASKEASRKLVNNLGGISRRIKKTDPSFAITMREVVEGGKRGVRVWRINAPEAQEAATA